MTESEYNKIIDRVLEDGGTLTLMEYKEIVEWMSNVGVKKYFGMRAQDWVDTIYSLTQSIKG